MSRNKSNQLHMFIMNWSNTIHYTEVSKAWNQVQ